MKLPRTTLSALAGTILTTAVFAGALPVAPAVAAGVCITAVVLPKAQEASAYVAHVTTSYTGPYRLNMRATGLPAGLTLSPSGYVTGTPTASGAFSVTFSLGSLGCSTKTLPLTVTKDQHAVASFWGKDGEVAADTPVDIPGLSDVTGVGFEGRTSLFVKGDGTVWRWSSFNPATGQDVPVASAPAPVQVAGLSGITQVVGTLPGITDGPYALALRYDGTVWIVGTTYTNVIGSDIFDQTWVQTEYATPTQVPGLKDVVAISTGDSYKYALTSDGRVWGWGLNTDNALGAGEGTMIVTTPTPVPGMTDIVAISANVEIGYGVRANGTVLAIGQRVKKQFELATEPAGDIVQVPGLTGVTALAAGIAAEHALAGGRVWSWGWNDFGGTGNGSTQWVDLPVVASGLTGVTAIGADDSTGYAMVGSAMYAFGDNLANGAFRSATPVLSKVQYALATSGDAAVHLRVPPIRR